MGHIISPLKKINEPKARGYIFLNGNVRYERDLVVMCRNYIHDPDTFIPELNQSKKVLIITAAWGKNEHNERHVIDSFKEIGIPEKIKNGYPTNIQNLSLRSMFYYFKEKEPLLYRIYNYKQAMIRSIKQTYYVQNYYSLKDLENLLEWLSKKYPELTLFDFYHLAEYPFEQNRPLYFRNYLNLKKEDEKKLKALQSISRDRAALGYCSSINSLITFLKKKDDTMFKVFEILEEDFIENSGIKNNDLYCAQREELSRRIMSSASIFVFGGNVYKLNNTLRFYGLKPIIENALNQGTNMYGVSAGSIVTTGRFAFCESTEFRGGYLNSQDTGLSLVDNIWIFPHANDYDYITKEDESMLSLFGLRYKGTCVGISEKSILMCGKVFKDKKKTESHNVYRSIGLDPVHVFSLQGQRIDLDKNDQILLEGSEFYPGHNVVVSEEDLKKLKSGEICLKPKNK